jgi:cyanophycinase
MRRLLLALLLSVLTIGCAHTGTSMSGNAATRSGRGWLVIVGGGPSSSAVTQRFVELAGGAGRARILVFPMASADSGTGSASVAAWKRLGASAWSVNLTREQAMDTALVHMLDSATGIWFPGGDQNRITRVLLGTPMANALRSRYLSGAIVGGTSAGAAVMSTPMITGDERSPGGTRRDTTQNWITIAPDNVVIAPGLGLATGVIVDQHFLRRRRHNRLISLVLEHPALIGAGIDESTALLVAPDGRWSVVGESAVLIFDAREARVTGSSGKPLAAAGMRMHVLSSGSRYDPRTGEARLP